MLKEIRWQGLPAKKETPLSRTLHNLRLVESHDHRWALGLSPGNFALY